MSLRARLALPRILLAPGVYDAFTALMAEGAGAEAVYLSGASIAYTRLGRPDIGLVSMAEVAETLALIAERVAVPVIVDADTGFGNALNVERTVRTFERAGAAAIQIEDQTMPKRCGHLTGKSLVPAAEMTGKIRAALDARRSAETLIVARTDAIAVEGIDRALDRAHAYAEAGADVLFVEAPESAAHLSRIVTELGPRAPLLANMVEGGATPMRTAAELEAAGFSVAIFPGAIARAVGHMGQVFYGSLMAHGTTEPFRSAMLDFAGLNRLIGTPETLARGARYDPSAAGDTE